MTTGEQEKNPKLTDDAVGGMGWLERLLSIGRLWNPPNTTGQPSRGKRRQLRERKDNWQAARLPHEAAVKLLLGEHETRQQRRAEAFALEFYEVSRDLRAEPRKARRRIARMRLKLRAAEVASR